MSTTASFSSLISPLQKLLCSLCNLAKIKIQQWEKNAVKEKGCRFYIRRTIQLPATSNNSAQRRWGVGVVVIVLCMKVDNRQVVSD
mmetsp:Transcript_3855/g.5482  ORF Transcript_3855/g.5482 Transcript_3855/m.5482 type:complete len:86 (+) Transcript_3855:118-375(+)